MIKTETSTKNKSLVQMIWIESLLITDSSNFCNESLLQVIISLLQVIISLLQVIISLLQVIISLLQVIISLLQVILYVQSTIFQLNRDGSSWVEQVLS